MENSDRPRVDASRRQDASHNRANFLIGTLKILLRLCSLLRNRLPRQVGCTPPGDIKEKIDEIKNMLDYSSENPGKKVLPCTVIK
jgi:hypothetical protein